MIVPPASMIQVSLSEFTQGLLPAYQASIFKYECKLAAHPWCFATMPLIFVGTDCPFLRCTLHQGCDGFLPSRHGSRANSWRSRAVRQANHRPHGLGGPGLKRGWTRLSLEESRVRQNLWRVSRRRHEPSSLPQLPLALCPRRSRLRPAPRLRPRYVSRWYLALSPSLQLSAADSGCRRDQMVVRSQPVAYQ